MDRNYTYIPALHGEVPLSAYSSFLPERGNLCPASRILQFLTLGPFVLETDGAFETEYLYERHKTLDCDYLLPDGGEANVMPVLGQRMRNLYYGPEELVWKEGYRKWNALRFDKEGEDCDDALFATPQRNCVFYAATYVRCEGAQEAILSYENSGCLLYLNGRLIDRAPYGRVKSLQTLGRQVAVHFQDGLNRILFKLRTGYIADTIDLSMPFMAIHPIALKSGSLGITYPQLTGAYLGEGESTRQMFYVFSGAFGAEGKGRFSYTSGEYRESTEIEPLPPGGSAVLRLGSPLAGASNPKTASVLLAAEGAAPASGTLEMQVQPRTDFHGTEHLFSDFHFDTTYHQEQRIYALGAFHITKCMLEQLRKNADFRVILSEIDYLHPYYSLYPQDRALIRKAFRENLAEADCFYNQPNELTSSPEALVRNLIYGQKYHMEYLGQPALVYTPGDVFGHPNQMSQICKKGECQACRWGKVIVGLDSAFRHMSPDGTCLTHTKGISMDDALRLRLTDCENSSHPDDTYSPYPVTDGMPWQKDSATHARYSLFTHLLAGVDAADAGHRAKCGRGLLQIHSRDLTQHHSGVLLTRSDFKQGNRLAENLMVTAEKLAVIAALHGASYPEKALDKAWRQILCAQHHDSITGTNNEISFVDLMLEYREAVQLAENIINGALSMLSGAIGIQGGRAVLVFNPHPWARREPVYLPLPSEGGLAVTDESGREYPVVSAGVYPDGRARGCFLPDAPALGYKAYRLAAGEIPAPETSGECVIENEHYRVTVDPARGGGIVSLWDKTNGRELVAPGADGPANQVAVLREVPDRMETQHEFYTTGQKLLSSESPARVRRKRTPLFSRLDVVSRLGTIAVLRQQITLWQGIRRVDFATVIEDYQGRDDLFTVTFPVNIQGGQAVYDDRFAPHVTGKSLNKLSFQTHQFLSYSHSRIAPANQWFELGPTVTVQLGTRGSLNIGMTAVVRREGAPLAAADTLLRALTEKAIPVTLFPEETQHGGWQVVHFNEDLENTDTRFVLSSATEETGEYALRLLERLSPAEREAFERQVASHGAAVLYAVDRDNMLSKPVDVFLVRARDAEALNRWAEDALCQLESGPVLRLPHPFCADPCPRADDYGVALLNNGNIACSVEGDNLISMMLFHTADFYGNKGRTTGGGQLIPEQKTFHASYALYSHAGDYRTGEVYRRAMEFNDPLIGHEFTPAGKALPAEHGYLACPPAFTLTCMKAGGYDLAGMKTARTGLKTRGIVLRGFENEGTRKSVRFDLGFALETVHAVNLLEHDARPLTAQTGGFDAPAGGYSIETYALSPRMLTPCLAGDLTEEAEPVQPVFVRSWEQDRGALPMGYMTVAGVIDRMVEKSAADDLSLNIHLSNNRADASIRGTMQLCATDGLTCSASSIPYCLAPGESGVWPITVTKSREEQGMLRLLYEDDGQTFTDVLEIGRFEPDMTLEDRGDAITATVTNRTDQPVSGELQLAAPIETWNSDQNPHGLSRLSWGPYKVDVAPGESREYVFPLQSPSDHCFRAFWAVGKLMVNDHIVFASTQRKGPRHNHWTHVFAQEIRDDGGSLRKYYHLNDLADFDESI